MKRIKFFERIEAFAQAIFSGDGVFDVQGEFYFLPWECSAFNTSLYRKQSPYVAQQAFLKGLVRRGYFEEQRIKELPSALRDKVAVLKSSGNHKAYIIKDFEGIRKILESPPLAASAWIIPKKDKVEELLEELSKHLPPEKISAIRAIIDYKRPS